MTVSLTVLQLISSFCCALSTASAMAAAMGGSRALPCDPGFGELTEVHGELTEVLRKGHAHGHTLSTKEPGGVRRCLRPSRAERGRRQSAGVRRLHRAG